MPQSNDFKNPENANNFDIRCGSLITVKMNRNHWEIVYCEFFPCDELNYGLNNEEKCWAEINAACAEHFEKCDWEDRNDRAMAILDTMNDIFDQYDVDRVRFSDDSDSDTSDSD